MSRPALEDIVRRDAGKGEPAEEGCQGFRVVVDAVEDRRLVDDDDSGLPERVGGLYRDIGELAGMVEMRHQVDAFLRRAVR